MSKTIEYRIGDATAPVGDDPKIIIHCCNDTGGWGRGFVLALSRRWKEPEARFRAWIGAKLGDVDLVSVGPSLWVANIIGQHGVVNTKDGPPIRYEAIRAGLKRVCELAKLNNASVHGPRLGSALAGGEWELIEAIIQEELCDKDVSVTIYDLMATKKRVYSWGS